MSAFYSFLKKFGYRNNMPGKEKVLMKFIHCADIHLDSPFTLMSASDAVSRRSQLRSDFSSAVLYAKSEGCELFIISGDLFDDEYVTKDTLEMLVGEMSSFPACRFVISPGNHDYYSAKSPYEFTEWPENVHIFTSDKLEYIDLPGTDVRVYGYAFVSDTMTDSPLTGFTVHDKDKINILAAHGDLCKGFSPYCPILESDIEKSGFDYVALGHVHKASGIKYAGKTAYAYPGCIEGRGFDETGYKGVLAGEITKESLKLRPVRFSKGRYEVCTVDVTGAGSLAGVSGKIIEACAEFGNDTILRLVLEGVTAPEFSADDTAVKALLTKVGSVEVKDNTLPLYNAGFLKDDKTIVGLFYRNLEEKLVSEDIKTRQTARDALKYGLKALMGRDL